MTERAKDFLSILNGFRKLTVILLLLIVGITFRLVDLLSGKEFVELLSGTTIAYMTFNGMEHLTGAIKDWLKKKVK